MHFRLPRFIIPLLILLLIDVYSFQAVRTLAATWTPISRRTVYMLFWFVPVVTLIAIIYGVYVKPWYDWPRFTRIYLFAAFMILYLCKLAIIPFMLAEDVARGSTWIYHLFTRDKNFSGSKSGISRRQFISTLALAFAAIPFISLLYGMLVGGYRFGVKRVKLSFSNLPKSFDGKPRMIRL